MKIWHGYGSDHSANLVMIGEFKTEEDAERTKELIYTLSESAGSDLAEGIIEHWGTNEQLSEKTELKLRELQLHNIAPSDIADFALTEMSVTRSGTTLRFQTDDVGIGAFIKVLINNGAKVQIYSRDDFPDTTDNSIQ